MTKSELISRLAGRVSPPLDPPDARACVQVILDAMTRTLGQGGRIELRGFGSFKLNDRAPRIGRNPRTGDKVQVPGKSVPHFKAGQELRERVARSNTADTPVPQNRVSHGG